MSLPPLDIILRVSEEKHYQSQVTFRRAVVRAVSGMRRANQIVVSKICK